MSILNNTAKSVKSAAKSSSKVQTLDQRIQELSSQGLTIIAFNVGPAHYEEKPTDRLQTILTSNKGSIKENSKTGMAWFSGSLAGTFMWSPKRKIWIAPPAVVGKGEDTRMPTTSKPTGIIGAWLGTIRNVLAERIEVLTEDGDLDEAAKLQAYIPKLNGDLLVRQEIAIDLPLSNDAVWKIANSFASNRKLADRKLQASVVLACRVTWPTEPDQVLEPKFKVVEILSWDGPVFDLPMGGREETPSSLLDDLAIGEELAFDSKAAQQKELANQADAAVAFLERGTRRTNRTSEYRRRQRQQQRAEKSAANAAATTGAEASTASPVIDSVDEDDLDALASV